MNNDSNNLFDTNQTTPLSLHDKYKLSWVEEVIDTETSSQKGINTVHTQSFLGKSISQKKIKIFIFIIILTLTSILGKIFYLQIIRGNYYIALAEKNIIRLLPIPAERGIMYDRFNKELVQNVPNFLLSIVPQKLPRDEVERKELIKRVAVLSGVSVEDIEKKLKKYQESSYQSLIIKENLEYKAALDLYLRNSDLPGIFIENSTKRKYLNNFQSNTSTLSLSHLLGYLGKIHDEEWQELKNKGYLVSDNVGKTGLEKTYETELRGIFGYRKIEVDALEREQSTLSVQAPMPGKNIYLSIDVEAQAKLESIIQNHLSKIKKERASAIALDPYTGEILALVSYPSYDNNEFSGGISSSTYQTYLNNSNQPLFNRAIAGVFPPGSTAKLILASAALQEGIINEHTTFNSTGGLRINRWFFPDWKIGGHGLTNVTKAIAESVNTFFYYIGGGYDNFKGLGVDKIVMYLSSFNLGKKTGIDLPGEKEGFVPSKEWKKEYKKETWFIGDTYNLSIGQGDLLVTPLQVAQWTSVIANGGKVVEPHLVYKIIDPSTKKEMVIKPKIINENFINKENINIVKQGMRSCVTSGSCGMLKNLPFFAAGKTGTAQWNKNKPNHAWFTSFAPYNNPRIVVTILVEEGEEGSLAAQPIAKEFLEWWGEKYLTQ